MNTTQLLFSEILHRKMNFILSLGALAVAAALFVAGPTLMQGYSQQSQQQLQQLEEETSAHMRQMQTKAEEDLAHLDKRTKRIMRDIGFNLRIVHRDTDLNRLFADFVALDMPEEYITRLAQSPEITKIAHLVATLQQPIQWEGKTRLIVGIAPEAVQTHVEQKQPMGFVIEEGTVFLGNLAGQGHQVGEKVTILEREFEIARILPPEGIADKDIAIGMNLKDAQQVLEKEGRISEIVALGCKCETVERVEEIRAQLELVLPEAQVTEIRSAAIARDEQRKLVEAHNRQLIADYKTGREQLAQQEKDQHAGVLQLFARITSVATPLLVLVCGIWVGLLAWTNVRERRSEIGLLRAIGKNSQDVALLFLGKAILLGLIGGAIGCVLGLGVARWVASGVLQLQAGDFTPHAMILLAALFGAPLVAALASYLPTLVAIRQDPASVLLEE